MTGRELVTASLRLIGAIAPSESLNATEATDALGALNRMISAWSNDMLMIYSRVRETLTLTASDGSYTVGSSGDLNTTRPQEILEASILDTAQNPDVDYPLRLVSLSEWQAIPAKDSDGLPTMLYDDGGYPLRTLRLYPRPSTTYTLVIWSWKELSSVSTLDTSLSVPPGYEEALIYNLAVRLCPEYGKSAPAEVVAIAQDGLASIRRVNTRPMYLRVDSALIQGGGSFNINTGDYW